MRGHNRVLAQLNAVHDPEEVGTIAVLQGQRTCKGYSFVYLTLNCVFACSFVCLSARSSVFLFVLIDCIDGCSFRFLLSAYVLVCLSGIWLVTLFIRLCADFFGCFPVLAFPVVSVHLFGAYCFIHPFVLLFVCHSFFSEFVYLTFFVSLLIRHCCLFQAAAGSCLSTFSLNAHRE